MTIMITQQAKLRAAERLDLLLTEEDGVHIGRAIAAGIFHFIGTRGQSEFYGAILHGRGCVLCVNSCMLVTVLAAGEPLTTDVEEETRKRGRDSTNHSRRSHRIRRRKLEESFEEERS